MPSWKKVVLHGSSGSLAHLTLENLTSQSVLATDASGNVIAGSISGYTLPTASNSTLGGIKVGNTLNISSGVLDAKTYQGAVATVLGEVPGSAGTAGIVPAASPAQASYFLKGDGTWAAPTNTVTRLRADNASSLLAGDFTITGSGATTVGYNNGVFTISSTDHDTTYSLFSGASASVNGAAGLVPGPRTGDQIKFLKGDGTWAVTPDTTYSTATSAALGLVKIGFTESGKDYPIELNASGQMFVNVPWSDTNTDTNTTYSIEGNQGDAGTTIVLTGSDNSKSSLIVAGSGATNVSYDTLLNTLTISSTDTNTDTTYSTATSTTLGLVKIGYTENGKNYPVELSSGQMFVNVPWTDTDTNTNTTYDLSAASITNGAAINLAGSDSTTDAVNIKGSGATTVSYDSTNRVLVISSTDTNTDTDTTYTAGTGLTLSGTTFSVTANTYAPASHTHSYLPLAGGTLTGALNINNSTQGSDAFYVDGVNGRLFTITDDLSDSLFSVNTIAGLPVIEAFADNTVKIGPFTSPVTIDTSGLLYVEGNQVATQTYVNTAISNLIDGAPAALDTLNELAAAINDNDSYASTITTALADKAPLASPALTGTPTAPTADTATNTTQIATTAFVKAQGYLKSYTDTVTRLGTGTGDLRSGDILLKGGGATSIAFASGTFTISSTDTNTWRDIHDTPVDGATTTSISSNWAFDNVKTAVPAGAVFTDTVYTHPTTAGNKHIPSGGSSGQILRWSADGTATWGADNDTTYSDATASRAGLMSTTDKSKLDGIAASANNYSLPIATTSVLGGVKIGYTASGKNYPVQLSNEQMYVNVPWTDTDTNTTYSAGTGLSLSGTTFNVGYAPYAYKVAAPPRNAFTVGGSADTFYPVVFNMAGGATANQLGTIQIERGGYDDPGYTGIGFSTMHIRLTMKPSGWGYGADFYRVDSYRATANLVAKLDRIYQSSRLVIWLRGATRYWWFDVENGASLHFDNSAGETYRETNGVYYDLSFDPVTTIADNLQYTRYEPGSQYYGGALKVVGNIYTDGTVDGRDIAADGTKLDGIASGANNYSLPVASASTLGGIKVGTNLSISDGVLSSTDTNTWRPLGTGATDAAAGNHTHDDRYYTETEVDTLLAGKQAAGTYLTSLPSHNHDDRYFTETESDSRFLKLAGGTMTGTLTAPTIVPTLFHYAYGWRKYFKVRSVGVSGGSINGKWVHLFSVEIAGSYDKALIKAKLNGYDDVSIGTEVIHALYENGGSTQENHDLYWYSIDNTASLFKAVKSIRTSASGLRNTYEVWAQMAGDWRDTFTMEVEFWEEENRALTFGTANGQDAEPTGDSNDIVKTSRQWAVNSNLYIGGNITLAGTVDGRDIATDGTKLDGIAANANNYSLPAASASTLGGIKIGTNLSIDTNGVVSSTDTNTWRPLGTGATDAAAGNHTHDDRYFTETESDSRFLKLAGGTLTGQLNLHAGNYEGSIVFGSVSTWRTGIRQHDDADAELRIWAKNADGMIFLATGYDGEPADIARPTDGLAIQGNKLGIGNFSAADPDYKLHVKGDIYANGGWVRVSGNDGLYFETHGGGWYMTDSSWIRSYGSKSVYVNAGFEVGSWIQNAGDYRTLNASNNGWNTTIYRNGGYPFFRGTTVGFEGARVYAPEGAVYTTSTSTVTGAFKIKLPTRKNNSSTMMRMTVKIYQYNTGNSYTIELGGYNYAGGNWYNIFAHQVSDAGVQLTVRFGYDSTGDCIWIGETNSSWSYPQVYVTEFQSGYSSIDSDWATGWSITPVTSFDTVEQERPAAVTVTSRNVSSYALTSLPSHTHVWTDITDRPTNVSSFTNDSGYITSYVNTVTRVGVADDVSSGDIVIRGAGATTVTKNAGTITITSTDTDTNTWRPLGTGATDAAAGNHTHDDRYYTESEVDTLLGTKAASSHTHNIVLTQGNYVWSADTRAGDYTTGIQTSFVQAANGWPNYGAVLHVGARGGSDAGGDFQLYMGHGSNYGGTSLRVRSADNDAAVSDSWTEWKTILDSSNVGNYALTALPSHTHDDRYYTESEVDTLLAGKAASSHTHDDRYYTESEVDTLLAGKLGSTANATSATQANVVAITGYGNGNFSFYQTSGAFAGYTGWANHFIGSHGDGSNYYNTVHIMPFWGPPKYSRLEGGALRGPWTYWTTENFNPDDKAAASHTHDDRYYTESEVDTLLAAKAASSHTHGIGSITDASRWWNNFGDNHSTRTSFDAAGGTLSTGFGWRFVQGGGNSPGWGSVGNGQYYALTVGLGNDYDSTLYGMQLAIPRNSTNPYLSVRFEENRVLGAWQKISAAYADSAGSVAWDNVSSKPATFAPSSHTHDDRYYTESEVNSLLNAKGDAIPVSQDGEALGNLASIVVLQEEQRAEFTTTSGNKFSVMLVG